MSNEVGPCVKKYEHKDGFSGVIRATIGAVQYEGYYVYNDSAYRDGELVHQTWRVQIFSSAEKWARVYDADFSPTAPCTVEECKQRCIDSIMEFYKRKM